MGNSFATDPSGEGVNLLVWQHQEAGDTEGWRRRMVLLHAGSSELHSSWSKAEEVEDVHACPFMRQVKLQYMWGDPSRRPRLERRELCRLPSMGDW